MSDTTFEVIEQKDAPPKPSANATNNEQMREYDNRIQNLLNSKMKNPVGVVTFDPNDEKVTSRAIKMKISRAAGRFNQKSTSWTNDANSGQVFFTLAERQPAK